MHWPVQYASLHANHVFLKKQNAQAVKTVSILMKKHIVAKHV
jgi:hypothetical protein